MRDLEFEVRHSFFLFKSDPVKTVSTKPLLHHLGLTTTMIVFGLLCVTFISINFIVLFLGCLTVRGQLC